MTFPKLENVAFSNSFIGMFFSLLKLNYYIFLITKAKPELAPRRQNASYINYNQHLYENR